MSREAVIQAIRLLAAECGTPEEIVRAVIDRLRPSIRLLPREGGGSRSLGGCRIGGVPDLPEGVEWPRYDEEDQYRDEGDAPLYFAFLAQIQLAEIAPFDVEHQLPESGMLYFFYGWHLDDASRVLYFPGLDLKLRRAEPPPELPSREVYRSIDVVSRLEWTVPSFAEPGLENFGLFEHSNFWGWLEDKVAAVQGLERHQVSKYRLLGYPQLYQVNALAEGTRLLLQVDSDWNPTAEGNRMMWGDLGTVYYTILVETLAAHRFEEAWVFWEND